MEEDMKSEWRVATNRACGEKDYQVYRIRNIEATDHAGNREFWGGVFKAKADAEQKATELNAEISELDKK